MTNKFPTIGSLYVYNPPPPLLEERGKEPVILLVLDVDSQNDIITWRCFEKERSWIWSSDSFAMRNHCLELA